MFEIVIYIYHEKFCVFRNNFGKQISYDINLVLGTVSPGTWKTIDANGHLLDLLLTHLSHVYGCPTPFKALL